MKFNGKKIPYIEYLPILIIAFILYKIVNNFSIVTNGFNFVISLLSYLIWGYAIAYFLNPIMVFIEKQLKVKRVVSISIIYVLLLTILFFSITIITPTLESNVKQITEDLPQYIDTTENWVIDTIENLRNIDKYNILSYIEDNITNFLKDATKYVSLPYLFKKTVGFTSGIMKFIIGLVIAVYFLSDKEKILKNIKKILFAFLNTTTASSIIDAGNKVNIIFSKFLIGKSIDSLIIGLLCFLVTSIFRMPFALLISIIVGVTNMIPYVGPFIGAVPAVLITLFIAPEKAFWMLLIIFIIQQFDGWILGPKIIGDHVGTSPLLIITAIIVGGGLFGIVGMFVGVPFFAAIKMFLGEYVDKKLKNKDVKIE